MFCQSVSSPCDIGNSDRYISLCVDERLSKNEFFDVKNEVSLLRELEFNTEERDVREQILDWRLTASDCSATARFIVSKIHGMKNLPDILTMHLEHELWSGWSPLGSGQAKRGSQLSSRFWLCTSDHYSVYPTNQDTRAQLRTQRKHVIGQDGDL